MNIIERTKKLNFPLGKYVVVGSGILEALGIRSANDIHCNSNTKIQRKRPWFGL